MFKKLLPLFLLCVFTLHTSAFAGGDDPVPLTKEKAEEKKKELDAKAGDSEENRGVIVAAADNRTHFVITARAAHLSLTLESLIEDAGIDDALPLPNVDAPALERVAIALTRLANGESSDAILQQIAVPLKIGEMQDLLVALNYLDVPILLPDLAIIFANRFLQDNKETDRAIFGNPIEFRKKYPKANLATDILQVLFGAARMSVISVEKQRAAMHEILGDDPRYAAVRDVFEKERALANGPIIERNILMFGTSRSGKTTLSNMVQNLFHVPPFMSFFRGTREPGIIRVDLMIAGLRYRFHFIDTPGLFEYTPDSERPRTNQEILAMIKKDLLAFGKPIHMALFTFSAEQGVSVEDIDALQEYIPVLNTLHWIPVITRAEAYSTDEKESIESQVREHPRLSGLVRDRGIFYSGALDPNDYEEASVRKARNIAKLRIRLINEIIGQTKPVQVGDLKWPLAPVVAERNNNVVRWRAAMERAQQLAAQDIPKAPKIWFEMCRPKSGQKKCEDSAISVQGTLKARLKELNERLEEYASLREDQLPNAELAGRIQALVTQIGELQGELTEVIPGITKVPAPKKDE